MRRLILIFLLGSFATFAQYSPSVSGSSLAAGEINSKPAVQSGTVAPSSLNCTNGKDFYINTSDHALYLCSVTGTPGSWAQTFGEGTYVTMPNHTTGTVLHTLTRLLNGQAAMQMTYDPSVFLTQTIGVCVSGCGTTGYARIQTSGIVDLAIDNPTGVNNILVLSQTTPGYATNVSAANPGPGLGTTVVGRSLTTNASPGTYSVWLNIIPAPLADRGYGTISQLPSTCTTSQNFFATDAPAGRNTYLCTGPNTWTAPLPVTQSGAASSLVETTNLGGVTAGTGGFSSPTWNLNWDGTAGNMFYKPTVADLTARFFVYPSGTGTSSLVAVANNSVSANSAKIEIKIAGDTASMQTTHQFGTGLSVLHQLLGEQTNNSSLLDIGFQFAGVTVHTITPTAMASPTFTASAAATTVAAGSISYGATTAAASNCGSLAGAAGCIVINVAGTTRYIPYF